MLNMFFVKNRTFSDLSIAASHARNRFIGFLIKAFGWNMSSVESSKNLMAPEIIMQTASVSDYTDISGQPEKILNDGAIPVKASLANKLLNDEQHLLFEDKYFMGIPESHLEELVNPTHLATNINEMLKNSFERRESFNP